MKKTFYRILLTAAILPTVGPGCVNEEREHHDPVVPLAFEPVMHAQVRAGETPDNTGDTGNNSFGVSAWTLDRNETWSTGSENAEPFLDREKLLRDGVFWYPESKPDWPPYQYNLACIGFAPFDAAARCDNSQGVVFDDVDTSTDPGDLRYTLLQANLSKNRNGGVISLPMIPALCEVSFRVRGVSEYETARIYVRSISLENVKLKAVSTRCRTPPGTSRTSREKSISSRATGRSTIRPRRSAKPAGSSPGSGCLAANRLRCRRPVAGPNPRGSVRTGDQTVALGRAPIYLHAGRQHLRRRGHSGKSLSNRLTSENRMIRISKYLIPLLAATAWGCNDPDRTDGPAPAAGNSPIRWDVASVTSPGTPSRSLVGPAPEEGQTPDWITLEQACTPTAAGGKGLAIGIWADYTYEDLQGDEITIKNLFSGTRLIYANKTNGNPYSYWNYEGEDLYWYIGGRYKFRAFFPQKISENVISSTSATTFVIEYPTHNLQEDLLLAYNAVDTTNPQVDLSKPVGLHFSHGLAAIRFIIKANFATEDKLTSCYFQNADTRDFATSGMLAYGSETETKSISWIWDTTLPSPRRSTTGKTPESRSRPTNTDRQPRQPHTPLREQPTGTSSPETTDGC